MCSTSKGQQSKMDKSSSNNKHTTVNTTNKISKKTSNAKTNERKRNNEKRKEKSRDAARCRRSRETEIFSELGTVLPLPRDEVEQLDKASIMRLSIAFLKARDMINLFPNVPEIEKPSKINRKKSSNEMSSTSYDEKLIMQSLDGFLLILSMDGDITFVSENISEYLGIQQIDIIGQPIWDYSHQCDHDELREALNIRRDIKNVKNKTDPQQKPYLYRDILLRIKCTLTSRGRSVNIKSASYKVIHVAGHIVTNYDDDDNERCQFISIGRPIPHPSNIEVPLGTSTFLTKHSLDMKFSYVDEKISLLGYKPDHLMGTSLYECHHSADSESLMGSFKCVISKGQTETCRYRFLARNGGYCWIVTQATLVYDKQKPQSVVCVNYILSCNC